MSTIETAVQTLQALVAAPGLQDEKIVEASHPFWEAEHYAEQEQVEAAFREKHQAVVERLKQAWSAPLFEGDWKSDGFPAWAAIESVSFTCWQLDSCAAYIAVQHHDKELPFLFVVGIHQV